MSDSPTSWEKNSKWYHEIVGKEGHYYHQTLIIPGVLKLLHFRKERSPSLLDLACGQGVLSRYLPPYVTYMGIDASIQLIEAANKYSHPSHHRFIKGDVTKDLPTYDSPFSHATLILALQNIENPLKVFQNASQHLQPDAPFLIVINHPCFRIPRQSSWHIDEASKIQYRRIDRYMTPMKIPIQTHPGKGIKSTQTWSFHHSLSDYSRWLRESGFVIELIEEWCSNKVSTGKAAKMENRSRQEIPLFMAILTRKTNILH